MIQRSKSWIGKKKAKLQTSQTKYTTAKSIIKKLLAKENKCKWSKHEKNAWKKKKTHFCLSWTTSQGQSRIKELNKTKYEQLN